MRSEYGSRALFSTIDLQDKRHVGYITRIRKNFGDSMAKKLVRWLRTMVVLL